LKELSLHILDIAQNSIKADASIIKIIIEEDIEKDLYSITIEDNGIGMDDDFLKVVDNPFITTRTTRKVGLGISLIKAATKRCDGDFRIYSEKGKGTKVIAIFKHSHIDRAPLGDIGQTIMTLINSNKDIEYTYIHDVNGNMFTFDTREVKRILDGVSIESSDVLLWIKDYINENIDILYEHINHL